MATSIKNNHNLYLIEQIVGLKRMRYPIFEGENLYVYSPAIQSNANELKVEGVDISTENMQKILAYKSKKLALLIIRYFEEFLIIDSLQLNEKLDGITREGKWTFKVIKTEDMKIELYLPKSNIRLKPAVIKKRNFKEFLKTKYGIEVTEREYSVDNETDIVSHIQNYITSKGYNYSEANIKNLYLSIRSKPFVIISGISGTGKTKIVQLFAESIGATEENGQFTLIPIRPDWSDSSDLLGYTDIKGDFIEGPLTKVVREANYNLDRPFFVLLDELNLARVEYYFSDVLSIMESRKKDGDTYTSSTLIEIVNEKLTLPNNLYIIGTVNMDETTHPFSKKVLDRANTIEFNEIHLNNFSFLKNTEPVEPIQLANSSIEAGYIQLKDCYESNENIVEYVSNELTTINKIIEPLNAHVGYRVRDEICFYMIYNDEGSLFERDEAFDYCLMQKVLPRLAGSGLKIRTVLEQLFRYFTGDIYTFDEVYDTVNVRYPLSAKKVYDMLGRLGDEGFTSFWIS